MAVVPCELLLYPELLSNEQLICIIQERHLRIENIERMSRCELIELFRNFCVPYGQRKYRDTGRGKVLNKTRHYSPEPAPRRNVTILNNHQSNIKVPHSKCDRLKPPPEPLCGQLKRIKLDTSVCINKDFNIKRKISIDSAITATDSPPPKKEKKKITWP